MNNRRITWLSESDPPDQFPPVSQALTEPDGLLAAGGDLSRERLLAAYRMGIFPWYDDGQPLLWWSPDPRCVFLPHDFRVSRRLRRAVRQTSACIRVNTDFAAVIRCCAAPRRSQQGTWITTDMIDAYERLFADGWAHSIEVWQDERLIGGLYGLAIGRVFYGESMFSRAASASTYALSYLARLLNMGRLALVDCQVVSAHLLSLGARQLPRDRFVESLAEATNPAIRFENWEYTPISCARLVED